MFELEEAKLPKLQAAVDHDNAQEYVDAYGDRSRHPPASRADSVACT